MLRFRNLAAFSGLVLMMVCAHAQAWAPKPTTKPARDGQAVYATYCAACHGRGMRDAPKPTDTVAWAPRLAQGKAVLYAHSIKGLGWMPTRGGCSTCTNEEIIAAVDYLLTLIPPEPK